MSHELCGGSSTIIKEPTDPLVPSRAEGINRQSLVLLVSDQCDQKLLRLFFVFCLIVLFARRGGIWGLQPITTTTTTMVVGLKLKRCRFTRGATLPVSPLLFFLDHDHSALSKLYPSSISLPLFLLLVTSLRRGRLEDFGFLDFSFPRGSSAAPSPPSL